MARLVDKIRASIQDCRLIGNGETAVVAVSGGADSVALLHVLVSLGYRCVVAHCDFHLRGEESERDRGYVEGLASRMGVKCEVTHFDVPAYEREHGVSTEMACRELRYEWFERVRVANGASCIAVAHHRDDNIETFFLNLLRGTGIAGLSGMSPRNGKVVRPMLDCTRAEVEEYLHEQGIGYVTDSTNLSNEFKRNKLRNVVLPAIRELFPGADDAMAATMSLLRENEAVYREAVAGKGRLYRHGMTVDVAGLVANERCAGTLLFEFLRPYGFNSTHVKDIISSVGASGKRFYSPQWVALLDRGRLLLEDRAGMGPVDDEYVIDLVNPVGIPVDIDVSVLDYDGTPVSGVGTDTILLDASVLDGNPRFVLRHWRKGDRIAPFGMRGTKKVSDIFSDAKLSLTEKEGIWLLTRNDEVLWVVGMRASRHYPVAQGTSRYIRLSYVRKTDEKLFC